jgi:citrate synthase
MATVLKQKLASQIPALRDEIRGIIKGHGDHVISEVTVTQAYGGMRGVKAMVCDTSLVEPEKGLIIRGIPLLEGLTDKWPEEIFWLLLTGDLPTREERDSLSRAYADRSEVPGYVWDVLRTMPEDSHPMAMLSTGILVMERESRFRAAYDRGVKKEDYWDPMFEEALDLLGKLPSLAAGVYRIRYKKGDLIPYDRGLDWGANYAHMIGIDNPEFYDYMRLYLTLHCDHEGGNVSANTCHTVGSALSDAYYAVSAGLNGLAGPLHGLANQECLKWVLGVIERFNGPPTSEQLRDYAWETLNSGKVIPGYGHAVLRVPDPRFIAFLDFGKKHLSDDPVFKTVDTIFQVVPDVLKEHGKAKNPWPNVDAGSGSILYHYGLREFAYYTVLFSVSRAQGMLAQLIINRAMGTSITRPKSVGTKWIEEQVGM